MSQFTAVIGCGWTVIYPVGITKVRAFLTFIPPLTLFFPLAAKMIGKRLLLAPAGRPLILVKHSGFDRTIDGCIADLYLCGFELEPV